jgi:hypothetical protein
MKDVQAIREAFSPQKRTFRTSDQEIYSLVYIFLGNFCSPGSRSISGSSQQKSMGTILRIRIHNAASYINGTPILFSLGCMVYTWIKYEY